MNSRPVPPTSAPVLVAAKWSTPGPSVESQAFPTTRVPSKHSNTIVAPDPMTLPVRDAPAAWRTVLSVWIWTLNPLRASEPEIWTRTVRVLPCEAKRTSGDAGQPTVTLSVRQTVPVAACALGIAAGRTGSIEMINRGIMSNSFGFFKLVCTNFSNVAIPDYSI